MKDDCPVCGNFLEEEYQHFRCKGCGFILPCCEGAPLPEVKLRKALQEEAIEKTSSLTVDDEKLDYIKQEAKRGIGKEERLV